MKEIVHALREPTAEPAIEIPRVIQPAGPHTAFDEREARSAIGAMRQCFQSFTKRPEDFSLLNELYCHVHAFSGRTQSAGLVAAHRLAGVFADFTHGLYHNPVQINSSTLRSLSQTIEFLAVLMREKDLANLKDPAQGLIYAVDDDPDNCETIKLAMETANIRTECALDPGTALAELSSRRSNLILLDINLPVMDGFELCSHIRQIEHHITTPIVFLTGLATLENRVQSSLSGGNDFIAKPFNLYELTVKSLTHILRAQLHPA
jgi:CheY-like chemotaxis protein